ncbi:MAG: chorismate synthase, partial [Candidatus Woesearchaeota archaeon]|nr:chorismate synthase [Candidatus Woesearchaeota archaeon]
MAGDSIGNAFKVTNWGESHGKAIGAIIEGCPPNITLGEKDIQNELDRRKPGQSSITTQRKEEDKVEILSGVFEGKTTGSPISLIIYNKDAKPSDYKDISIKFRPSHADFTTSKKYGIRDPNGGGRSSARITAGNVAAGAVARKIIKDIEIVAYVKRIKDIDAEVDLDTVTRHDVESNIVRCPDKDAAKKMIRLIEKTSAAGDSLGGVIECVIRGVPIGLGEPVFDKLSSDLAKAIMSINAAKGFELGSGFDGTRMLGSQHNDEFIADKKDGKIRTKTNNSGGIQGGISNGMPIIFRVGFKPTSTIQKKQDTVDIDGKAAVLE